MATLFLFLAACEQAPSVPKPRAYPKVEFPERTYVTFDESYCSFTFEMPSYAKVQQDTVFFNEKPIDPCWFDIYYPDFDCRIYCSYYPITDENPFERLNSDAFRLAMEHNKKATFIDELPFSKPNGVSGIIFNLEGPVATPFQFYVTDSTQHFMRGALYFNSKIRPDSLAPMHEFVKEDITHMVNTFAWTRD
ncbi:MAG: hypothetical protein HKN87_14290 [Saprospiraceae bacterium]|nr:hypothetical protein [Saprospiraceae bacterium]